MEEEPEKEVIKDLKKRVKELLKEDENQQCSECFSKKHKPKFMAILKAPIDSGNKQLGIFCCKNCIVFLIALGGDYCQVKSLNDPEEWNEKDIETLERSGNKAVNAIYLSALQGNHTKKDMGSLASAAYVESKYKQCLYFSQVAFHEQMQLRAMIQFAKDQKPMEPAVPTTTDKLEMALKRQKSLSEEGAGHLMKGLGPSSTHSAPALSRLRRSNTIAGFQGGIPGNANAQAEVRIQRTGSRSSFKRRVQRTKSNGEEKAQPRSNGRRSLAVRRVDSAGSMHNPGRTCLALSHGSDHGPLQLSQHNRVRRVTSAGSLRNCEWSSKPRLQRSRSTSSDPLLSKQNSNHSRRSRRSMRRSFTRNLSNGSPSSRSPLQRKCSTGSSRSPPRPKSVRAISQPRPNLEQNLDDSLSDGNSSLSLSDMESIFNGEISDSDDRSLDSSNSHNEGSHGSKLELLSAALQTFTAKAASSSTGLSVVAALENPKMEAQPKPDSNAVLENPKKETPPKSDSEAVNPQEPYLKREMMFDVVSAAEQSNQALPIVLRKQLEGKVEKEEAKESCSVGPDEKEKASFVKRQMLADMMETGLALST